MKSIFAAVRLDDGRYFKEVNAIGSYTFTSSLGSSRLFFLDEWDMEEIRETAENCGGKIYVYECTPVVGAYPVTEKSEIEGIAAKDIRRLVL